jgi:hypothetical protein
VGQHDVPSLALAPPEPQQLEHLQPEYSGVIRMRQQPLVVLESDDVRPYGDIATQHALDVPPRTV